ncbi:MAG: hypothetical protein COA50_07505 [Flavobacteriaceae bacterium]|nr:MAG: hypothetical protein COA50_07505 [Flavobacteriaceae bacterium]
MQNNKNNLSRRKFLTATTVASLAFGVATLNNCTSKEKLLDKKHALGSFLKKGYTHKDGYAGLLFSQIGYELGLPVKIIIRLPKKEYLSNKAICTLEPEENGQTYKTKGEYWGEIWGSHWWIFQFNDIKQEGEWNISVVDNNILVFAGEGLKVQKNILWSQTIEYASVDMLERRMHFTKVGAGWQDAGTLWVENCSQSGMIISLEDLLEKSSKQFNQKFIRRIQEQIIVGCNYLVMTQKKAKELGYAEGAFTHDLHGHEHDIIPNDANKAVVALLRASALLPDTYQDKKKEYLEAGIKGYYWITQLAKPLGSIGMQISQRGIPDNTVIPNNEWPTRDLLMMCWASIELWKINDSDEAKKNAINYASQIMNRQIQQGNSENGYFGHFYEFDSLNHSENAWTHGILNNNKKAFGTDIGAYFPNYLVPIIEMYKIWPDHKDRNNWLSTLTNFVEGYLKPVCKNSPFNLLPLGVFGAEGPNWFCGTFHGSNAIYGYTAALAIELFFLLKDDDLKEIAYDNLQWIAGLNSGITKENVKLGSIVFSTDVPDGAALPASMICGIGNRWAGSWFQTRGVICNGFTNGEQFKYDIAINKKNDGPHSFTDEDWIPHSAGWITGLIRLNQALVASNI